MSKNHWEVSRIDKNTDSKNPKFSFNEPSAEDLEEETKKELKQIFKKSFEDEKADKELVERVKKSWEGVKDVERKIYLSLKEQSDFRRLWKSNKKSHSESNVMKQNKAEDQLEAESEELKSNRALTNLEKQERLQKIKNNNTFKTISLITTILTLTGLSIYGVSSLVKKSKKIKK